MRKILASLRRRWPGERGMPAAATRQAAGLTRQAEAAEALPGAEPSRGRRRGDEDGLGATRRGPLTRNAGRSCGRGVGLGVSIRDLDAEQQNTASGALVEDVRSGSPAAKAGIQEGGCHHRVRRRARPERRATCRGSSRRRLKAAR